MSDTRLDLAGFELVGYTSGLSAGLTRVLADLNDEDLMSAARGGYVAVPARRVHADATVVEHRMATSEGVAILDLRLPAGLAPLRHAGDRPEVVGLRLAAVRIGLARKLLDQALAPQATPLPLLRCHLTMNKIADILTALNALHHHLTTMAGHPSRNAIADIHTRLTELDWQVATVFAPNGYDTDHPVRTLFVAELVANTWVGT